MKFYSFPPSPNVRKVNAVIAHLAIADIEHRIVNLAKGEHRRPEFLAMGQGRPPSRIRAAAALLRAVQVRTAPIATLLREAAPADPEIAEMLQSTRARQRVDITTALELLIGRAPTPSERDGVWALASPEVYVLLVEESGWSADQYEAWVARTLERGLPRS